MSFQPAASRAVTPRLGKTHIGRADLVIRSVATLLMFSTLASAQTAGSLKIERPWSRATPGGAKVAAGYLTITNGGQTDDRLVTVSTDIAGRAQVHEMQMTDQVMRMHEMPGGLVIPAGKTVTLKPMSYHLMFEGLARPLTQGEHFSAKLTFEKAGTIDATFDVEAIGATSAAPISPGKTKMEQ